MLVELEQPVDNAWRPANWHVNYAKKSQPFFLADLGLLHHRVRWVSIYWVNGQYHHAAVRYLCGNSGNPGKGRFHEHVNGALCRTCERVATGKGQPSANQLTGRNVLLGGTGWFSVEEMNAR